MVYKNKVIEMSPEQIANLLDEVNNFLKYLQQEGFDEKVITFAITKSCISLFCNQEESLITSLHPIISALNAVLNEEMNIIQLSTIQ